MISLLLVMLVLAATNLAATLHVQPRQRAPFAVAGLALVFALAGPLAGMVHLPLPAQFLLLWLFVIPISLVCATAFTLLGLIMVTHATLRLSSGTGDQRIRRSLSRRVVRTVPLVVLVAAIVLISGAQLWQPLQVSRAPLQGVETSVGTVVQGVRYGATFTGTLEGETGGAFSASVNYSPAVPAPALQHALTGGSWSLAVYRAGRFQGTLYGPVTGGTVHWNVDVSQAQVTANLQIAGGTGLYLGRHGRARFSGQLLHLTFPATVAGTLTLEVS